MHWGKAVAKHEELVFLAPYDPMQDALSERMGGEEAEQRLLFWGQAMANQQRWNSANLFQPRPVAKAFAAKHTWNDGGVFGSTWVFLDLDGRELFKVGKRTDGILLCWECNAAACCGHIVEALSYWQGQNEVEGKQP